MVNKLAVSKLDRMMNQKQQQLMSDLATEMAEAITSRPKWSETSIRDYFVGFMICQVLHGKLVIGPKAAK
jgi:hypothetical protein